MGRIHSRVSVVLVVYDAYRDRRIEDGSIILRNGQGVPVIAKGGGYYVFLEQEGTDCLDIEIRSALYQDRNFRVEIGEDGVRTEYVRLEPSVRYPFLSGTTFLKGKLEKGRDAFLILEKETGEVRLTKDAGSGDRTLTLYGLSRESGGRRFRITDTVEGYAESFTVGQPLDGAGHDFGLTDGLRHGYRKGKCRIQSCIPVGVPEDGIFFTALTNVPKEGSLADFYVDGKNRRQVFLEYGKENQFSC